MSTPKYGGITEAYVDQLRGATVPESASLSELIGSGNPSSENIILSMDIVPHYSGQFKYYTIDFVGRLSGKIEGPSGRLIGYELYLDGAFAEELSKDSSGNVSSIKLIRRNNVHFQPLNLEDGMIVAEDGNFALIYTASRKFFECEDAEKVMLQLNEQNEFGILYIKPVFAFIETRPKYFPFGISLEAASSFACEQLDPAD